MKEICFRIKKLVALIFYKFLLIFSGYSILMQNILLQNIWIEWLWREFCLHNTLRWSVRNKSMVGVFEVKRM